MSKILIASILSVVVVFPGKSALAQDCQKMAVISTDGYVNIRSSPQVKASNIIATWYSGGSIAVVDRYRGWWQIDRPVSGWVKATQVKKVSCQSAWNTLYQMGHPAIKRFGQRASAGDLKSAEILVKMSRGLDGNTAEFYAETLCNWAKKNPRFLVSVLAKQPVYIRQSVLEMVDFGLGSQQSPERLSFEYFIEKLPHTHPIVNDWRNRKR